MNGESRKWYAWQVPCNCRLLKDPSWKAKGPTLELKSVAAAKCLTLSSFKYRTRPGLHRTLEKGAQTGTWVDL